MYCPRVSPGSYKVKSTIISWKEKLLNLIMVSPNNTIVSKLFQLSYQIGLNAIWLEEMGRWRDGKPFHGGLIC